MENKKTKLTISGSLKKPFKNFSSSKNQGKKTTIIEKNSETYKDKKDFKRQTNFKSVATGFKRAPQYNPNFSKKTPSAISDFERRKLAEQRATRRLKNETEDKDKKGKSGTKKREVKLTVSRALSDEIETRERSLASVKRARQKELKNTLKKDDKENLKPVKRDINIPEAITVRELANRMAEQSSNVIKFLSLIDKNVELCKLLRENVLTENFDAISQFEISSSHPKTNTTLSQLPSPDCLSNHIEFMCSSLSSTVIIISSKTSSCEQDTKENIKKIARYLIKLFCHNSS